MTRGQVARRLLESLRPLAPLMAISATARVVNQGLGVAIPAVAAGTVIGFGSGSDLGGFLLLLVVMAMVKGIFRYLEQFTGHAVAFRLLAGLRVDSYRRIVPLAPAGLEDDRTGDLVARVVGDIDRVEPFYAHTIAPLASAVMVPILAAIGLAIWVDPLVAGLFLAFPLSMILAQLLRAHRVAELSTQAREWGGETAAVFTDVVQGAREVAVFEAGESVSGRIEKESTRTMVVRKALSRISAARAGLSDLLAGAAVVSVTAVATWRFEAGIVDLAGLAVAITVAWVGTTAVRALEDIVPDLEQALAAAARLFDLSDREPTVPAPRSPTIRPSDGSVVFSDVTVEFERSDIPVLNEVDVVIADKSYVAVVGASGSGKSTLMELLMRFRDPDRGHVEVGGADLRDVDLSGLRDDITLVPQRPEIFFGTIADNLRLARPDAGENDIWQALDRAGLGSWARTLEHGLETAIGEMGDTLSGGQRQRIAIARAFLRNPKVLILDEATSELDVETEGGLLEELARERGHRTVIVVAHRLETVIDADEILVLDRGRVVERGRHEHLAARGGVYAGLWQRHLDFLADVS